MATQTIDLTRGQIAGAELVAKMKAEGWQHGTFARVDAKAVIIDATVAAESTCDECAATGAAFFAFTRPVATVVDASGVRRAHSYRAFAVCACGASREF